MLRIVSRKSGSAAAWAALSSAAETRNSLRLQPYLVELFGVVQDGR